MWGTPHRSRRTSTGLPSPRARAVPPGRAGARGGRGGCGARCGRPPRARGAGAAGRAAAPAARRPAGAGRECNNQQGGHGGATRRAASDVDRGHRGRLISVTPRSPPKRNVMKLNVAFVSIGFAILVQACEGEPIENGLLPPPGGGTSAPLGFRLGASGVDQINGVVVDPAGNVYVAGTFTASVDFNLGTGIAGLTSQGGPDGFVAKYTGTGGFVWAVRFGGTEAETVSALGRDGAGNLYVGGGFGGTTRFETRSEE